MINKRTYDRRIEGEFTGLMVHYDQAASALVRAKDADGRVIYYECPICQHRVYAGRSGFVKPTAERHVYYCQMRQYEQAHGIQRRKPNGGHKKRSR
ncbi:MAG: hypothetical protein MOB07_31470 [Acidobacteria bacterium]|nr:hypothetical protein [Acidobacteriota bacterium]